MSAAAPEEKITVELTPSEAEVVHHVLELGDQREPAASAIASVLRKLEQSTALFISNAGDPSAGTKAGTSRR